MKLKITQSLIFNLASLPTPDDTPTIAIRFSKAGGTQTIYLTLHQLHSLSELYQVNQHWVHNVLTAEHRAASCTQSTLL
jgi:hypothetical protein